MAKRMHVILWLISIMVDSCIAKAIITMTETQYEAEEGQQIEIGLLRHGIAASSISVVVQIKDPHAQGGQDFIGTSQALVFPAGRDDLVKKVLFTIADDDIPEPDESFVIYLSVPNGDGEAGTPDKTVLTILANDDSFGIFAFVQVVPIKVEELDHDNELRLPVSRSRGSYGDVDLHYEVLTNNSKNEDLGPNSDSITFYSGESNKNIILTVYADQIPEPDEVYTVQLTEATSVQGSSVGSHPIINSTRSEVTVIIAKNDAPVQFTQEEFRIEEADYDTSVSIVITRGLDTDGETIIGPISNLATVNYYLIPETATPGVDYIAYNNSVTFSPGITRTSFSVKILSDAIPEVSESFSIVLGSPTGDVVLVEPSTCVVIIGANDEPNGVLSLKTSTGQQYPRVIVNEDVDFNVTGFTVQRSGGRFGRVSIDWVLVRNDSSAGDGGDVMPTVGTVILDEGQAEQAIVMQVIRDDVPEPVERYFLKLLPGSVQGGGHAEGVLQGELIVQDSDDAHGIVQFISEDVQQIITITSPRKLMLSLVRSGGALGSLQVLYDVKYTHNGTSIQDIFLASMPTSAVFPADQHSLSLEVFIKNEAFLQIGALFTVSLLRVTLSDGSDIQPYNTPHFGELRQVNIAVSVETASGEVGFTEPYTRFVQEPEGSASSTQVQLELRRVGTNGNVNVIWRATGSGSNAGHMISSDITPLQGTIMMATGQKSAMLTLDVLADDRPEADEYIIVVIERVEPQDTQHIKPGGATIQLIIQENDNPGGMFHFAHQMALAYTVQEKMNPIELSIERSGAALVSRQLQYKIEPHGEAEFYGDTNIITFQPGEVSKNITVLARGDGIPELTEVFLLKLYSFGNKTAIIDSPSQVNITILSNDQPYGYFELSADNTTIYVEESKGADIRYARIPVLRQMGRFSVATVDWLLLNSSEPPDLQPSHGTLNFDLGVGQLTIDLEVIADQIPEGEEIFYVNISNPTGGATLGEYLMAAVHILQNDDPIYFEEPGVFEVSEGGTYSVTVLRSGRLEQLVTVKYHTLDGSATEAGRDYVIINEQKMVFKPGEDSKIITFTILEDDLPEPDEVFYLELYDEEGDVAVFGPPAKIIIMSNDLANGIVHFMSYNHKTTEEGKAVEFKLSRDVGIYGQADVFCQIYNNASGELVDNGEDFQSNTVMARFNDLDQYASLWVTPLTDGIPEFDEVFQIVLFNVTGGRADDPGQLAQYNLTVYLTVLKNDNPYGLFRIHKDSQEVNVPEDLYSFEDDSERVAYLKVERTKGLFTTVKVAWEIFSYQIAGAESLPLFIDLLLVGQTPASVREIPVKGRQATGTTVLQFDGCQLCHVTVPSHYHPSYTDIEDGFSLSTWIQPQGNTEGYVIAKTSPDGATYYYALSVSTKKQGKFSSLMLTFQYSTTQKPIVTEKQEVNIDVVDGHWHFIVVAVDGGLVYFYVNGARRGVRSLESGRIRDGPGLLLVGAVAPGEHHYRGILQDVRFYSRKLEDNELLELYEMPSAEDLYPISGYLTFEEGQTMKNITIFVLDDHEEEANDVFTVKLISASGGADVEKGMDVATLTVLKSDNANGLFGFSAPCLPLIAQSEDATFHCPVIRNRGDSDTVTLTWRVINESQEIAADDFVSASGEIIFKPGERNKMLSVQILDDDLPELAEVFHVVLTAALSADGLVGSTNVSGASLDPERSSTTVTVPATDHPHGLLQFDVHRDSTQMRNDTWIEPLTESPSLSVPEEAGVVSFLITRAQGHVGAVSVEWRTIDGTARSSAKSPPDFVAAVDRLSMLPGQLFSEVNITILDNNIPENDKYFWLELVNPQGGAAIGPGSRLLVTIEASDHAYGVFSIAESSRYITTEEIEDTGFTTVPIKVIREGGTIGQVNITWITVNDTENDILDGIGVLRFEDGQRDGEISVKIRGDTIPELDEQYGIVLVNTSKGSLGEPTDVISYITILANDDPYGVFIIAKKSRLLVVEEGPGLVSSVNITVERKANSGELGNVMVSYRTLEHDELFPYLPGGFTRADSQDYDNQTGSVYFVAGQTTAMFNITIKDDAIPELEETLFVILTGAILILDSEEKEKVNNVMSSPRIGAVTKAYSQIIINRNDNPNGIIELSASEVQVTEENVNPLVMAVRREGLYGMIVVNYEVTAMSALYGLDYTVSSSQIKLLNGQNESIIPLSIINDNIPEPDEQFAVRLLPQIDGGATLGNLTECIITILESDDLHGAFAFESRSLSTEEPQTTNNQIFEIPVIRQGGTEGLVSIQWRATVEGASVINDISPTSGKISFISNQARQMIAISVLADDIPENTEEINFELLSASNGGHILDTGSHMILRILPNDNPHGILEFTQPDYLIQELDNDTTQYVTITRVGGNFGSLQIQYYTSELDIIKEALRRYPALTDYFTPDPGLAPIRPEIGTSWNVNNQPDTLQACMKYCMLTEACKMVYYSAQPVMCRWYSVADVQHIDNRTGYVLYQKREDRTKPLYTMRARDGIDFKSVPRASVIIPDGAQEGLLPVLIYADDDPELNESFSITVTSVHLQGELPLNPSDLPRLGHNKNAIVTIEINDDANGVFTLYSTDPRSKDEGHTVIVEEREKFAVELIVERKGGSIGTTAVTWFINQQRTTATRGNDFIADGATLSFEHGVTQKRITIGIEDDVVPEDDEVIIVQLSEPQGGAVLAKVHEVQIKIQANDHVAGLLSFKKPTHLVKEGDLLRLTVLRSRPAHGVVSTRWRIVSENSHQPSEQFRRTAGQLYFREGEMEKEILLHVLVDNQPKINQEYRLQLYNIETSGVPETGAAIVDDNNGEAHITIEGGNEPHGVFGFAPRVLDAPPRIAEIGAYNITVDRKFGAIGVVRVIYDIRIGSLETLTSDLQLATPVLDFKAVTDGSVVFGDGQGSGMITIQVVDDNIPEVDEVFIVQLKRVELIQPQSSTFLPKLDKKAMITEVIITANDGTQGEVIFSQETSRISVQEKSSNVTLVVLRRRGTFGTVSVYCYAQNALIVDGQSGAVRGEDFTFHAKDLVFAPGEDRKTITVTILEDDLPEPDESLEVILDSPKQGLSLGTPHKAIITILANDDASGAISFLDPYNVSVHEPAEDSPDPGIIQIGLVRGPGSFGIVSVQFHVTGHPEGPGLDITPVNGTVTFQDKQATTMLELTVIKDTEPEEDEVYTIILSQPDGGATLGQITQKLIIIEANDAPYGLLEIYPGGTRNSSLTVEEDVGLLYFDVIRSHGNMHRVSVDMVTDDGTATAEIGANFSLSFIQKIKNKMCTSWYSFSVDGVTYVLLLNAAWTGVMTSSVGSNGQAPLDGHGQLTPSILYRWQGVLMPVQTVETDGATSAEAFSLNETAYLIISNQGQSGRRLTKSRLYAVDKNGTLTVIQEFSTRGATDVAYISDKSDHYIMITNYHDNRGNTRVKSDVYKWQPHKRQFTILPVYYLDTIGAMAVEVLHLDNQIFIFVASYLDSLTESHELKSSLFRFNPSEGFIVHQQLLTKGAISVTSFDTATDSYLIIASEQNNFGDVDQSVDVYSWNSATEKFVLIQKLPTLQVKHVHMFYLEEALRYYLVAAESAGKSEIFEWDTSILQFESIWSGPRLRDFYPVMIHQQETDVVLLLEAPDSNNIINLNINQVTTVDRTVSDFVPRSVTVIFEDGQTSVRLPVEVIDDSLPEDTETFFVRLIKPKLGAQLGPNDVVAVSVLSNDNGHGVIIFSKDSLVLHVEETPGSDNVVQLNVVRQFGVSGHIVVEWQMSGDHQGLYDLNPTQGTIEFADGQSVTTISITIRDDGIPEQDETSTVTLVRVLKDGSEIAGKGAVIGFPNKAQVTVLANDSPYGVVRWDKSQYSVIEPEDRSSLVTLRVIRSQGLAGDITVSYITSPAEDKLPINQAVSGLDYTAVQSSVTMAEGQSQAWIEVTILPDQDPELNESFLVNITGVKLIGSVEDDASRPTVHHPGSVAVVTIEENDNPRGVVQFSVTRNQEGRVDVYEGIGILELNVTRTLAGYGAVDVTWQVTPRESDIYDFSPAGGQLRFKEGVAVMPIKIYIEDDDKPEPLETFDVKLLSVSGGATLGTDTSVRVGIRRNDSPNGVLGFLQSQISVKESANMTDPQGTVHAVIVRTGTTGVISVQWRLNPEAVDDFLPPLAGQVTFNVNETRKTVILQTKPDDVLEGEELFTLSLISASNNADISPARADMIITILADQGANGIIQITPDTRQVFIGEPTVSTDGSVTINITRGVGIYGELIVSWILLPEDHRAFVQVQGQVIFHDLQENASIILMAVDDNIPEEKSTYSLQLIEVTGGAILDPAHSMADVIMVASDFPHGLFEFSEPLEITAAESEKQVTINVERHFGNIGQVQVFYITSPGTAQSNDTSNPDYMSASSWIIFEDGQTERSITVTLIDDSDPEGPENFYVNITRTQLLRPRHENYTTIEGLSLDMPPAVGSLSIVMITIDKNDLAEGVIEFDAPPPQGFIAHEDDGKILIPVIREHGLFGKVTVYFDSQDATAKQGYDYELPKSSLVIGDNQNRSHISVIIEDDSLQEFEESFSLILTGVKGGAALGSRTSIEITIAKSDFPNGEFGFRGPSEITIPNPDVLIDVPLMIERTKGNLGRQKLFWRIMGPNNPNTVLEETMDISYYDNSKAKETTSASFVWDDGEEGTRSFRLQVKPHEGWEIAKTYIVIIYDIQGTPAESGDGDISRNHGNVTLTVSKYGHPNGVIHFDGVAQLPRIISEPESGSIKLQFPLFRQDGTIGNIEVYWMVILQSSPNAVVRDVFPNNGSTSISDGQYTGMIELAILADDEPELDETFLMLLQHTAGGADIDLSFNTSMFTIRYNDAPHGKFGMQPQYQIVAVEPGNLKRYLQLNITRFAGLFGKVRVNFVIQYNQAKAGLSYAPSSGTVLFNNGDFSRVVRVQLESERFLTVNSTFTVTLTGALFVGDQEADPPIILADYSATQVMVPKEAANSEIGFLEKVIDVDEVSHRATVAVYRLGAFGSVTIDWRRGFPQITGPNGYDPGRIQPTSGTVTLPHGIDEASFTVQAFPDISKPVLHGLYMPYNPITSAPGGAVLRQGYRQCYIQPYGIVQFAEDSRQITIKESDIDNTEVKLTVERLFGSLDSIQIRFKTKGDTATENVDFQQIDNGAINIDPKQTKSTIFIEIRKDTLPEMDEKFYVVLNNVIRLPTGTEQDDSPRISSQYSTSTVTIQSSNDPYGVFSIEAEGSGRVSEPGSVTLIVSRTGGTFGQVGIRVRTVGGGEPWDDLIDVTPTSDQLDTIGEVLAVQNQSRKAIAGQDYQQLDTLLQFEEGAIKSSAVLYITDDTVPEDDESVFVYIQSQTKGARIAQPSTDAGLKGYAEIVIKRNDFWNGWIGFYRNSSKVSVDEDIGRPLVLTVERRNSSLEDLKLYWRALVDTDDSAVYSSRIDLRQQLVSTSGSIQCQHGQRFCNFYILINNDQIPENSTWFLVELYFNSLLADQGARIDPEHRFANVTILPSDNPNGLIQFTDNSRFVFIDQQQDMIPLQIRRLGYSGKQVTVLYHTVQIIEPTGFGGTKVYAALEGADYNKNQGTLVFEPGQIEKTVIVERDHLRASDNPYPKLFKVKLSHISTNAELGVSESSIIITEKAEHEIWKLWAEGQTDQNNGTLDNLMTKLTIAVQNMDLSAAQLNIIMDIIDRILDIAMDKAPLSVSVHTNIMRVMCTLLDPERNDATRGKWQLSERMDRFALSYVAHLKCDTCCLEQFMESPTCEHVRFVVAKRYPEDINGFRWKTRNNDVLMVAEGMLRVLDHGKLSALPKCYPVVMMDYSSDLWFTTHRTQNLFLSHKVVSLKIKDEPSRILDQPVGFRIHTPGQGTPDKKSECVYFDEVAQQWMSSTQYGRQICTVKNNLIMAIDNYVDCACNHLSLYAVKSDPRNPDMIGYPLWFHISCFIAMAGLAFAILAHHVCIYSRFSASLLMHMFFAVLATEVCYVIDAYLSPFQLLNVTGENNSKCIVMSIFLHYFFTAQFTWMMVQAINYFKILVLNDEHTERKYVMYFLLGWGLPVILVAVFYIVTYIIYRFLTNLPPDKIYGDVTATGDICFVTNPVAGLAGILAPCLIFLMVVGIVFIQAYQMSPQWQSYDDIYKGRHNIQEVRFILLLFAFIVLTWLWGGLHMAYGQLWMLVLFCVFNIIMGLYVFIVYTLLRLPCTSCNAQQKAMYAINDTQVIQTEHQTPDRPPITNSVKGSPRAFIEEPWEKESIEIQNGVLHTNSMLRVKRTSPNANVYVLPAAGYNMKPPSFDQHESQDLNDLILALRAGEVVTSSESLDPLDRRDMTTDGSTGSRVEHKRISIADTHL